MYDILLMRRLRSQIRAERDPKKLKAICDVLQAMIDVNVSEVALKLKLLAKSYKRISQPFLPKLDLSSVRPK